MQTSETYLELRNAGYSAKHALSAAKTIEAFQELEAEAMVRLSLHEEQENYFDVYGEPEGYVGLNGRRVSAEQERKETCDLLESLGCWMALAEYKNADGNWQHAASIGMLMGYEKPLDPRQNWYVPDLMASAVEAARNASFAVAI